MRYSSLSYILYFSHSDINAGEIFENNGIWETCEEAFLSARVFRLGMKPVRYRQECLNTERENQFRQKFLQITRGAQGKRGVHQDTLLSPSQNKELRHDRAFLRHRRNRLSEGNSVMKCCRNWETVSGEGKPMPIKAPQVPVR